ncbi:Serine/threonine protein kinase [Blastococcus saxobsidens DD2]|uniref:Serine/threonine protein kinase n=1 Tax=Blastococcus saxobsidens (strain DD2) TaxID=1146883 RepID=H6RNX4_BLASD|nr:Serine/threonine protein kinase [Blastococcus saxobsidens DD2]
MAQIGAQVADALAATHAAGIVHRDVKPANILIGRGGRVAGLVKITDFGISHARGDVTLTQTGQLTGTPAFLAPEVAQGFEMTEASDVFSLGATLYTCLEGMPPFGMDDNALGMLHRVAGGQVMPPRRAGELTGPLLRMLAAGPTARPAMTEVRDELARLAAGRDGDTTTVLLARTDLRPSSGPAGTAVLASTPVSGPAPRPTPAAFTPVPRTPVPQPAPTPAPPAPAAPGRRRGAWAAAAIVAVFLAGALALLVNTLGDADPEEPAAGSTTSAPSEAPPTSEQPAPPPVEPEPPVEQEQPTAPAPAEEPEDDDRDEREEDGEGGGEGSDVDPLNEANIRAFLRDYHRLVLDDPARAWELTGPTLRANISRENYIRYWDQFSDVRLSDIAAEDGRSTATATMELRYPDGRRETGPHVFTFLDRDGVLILDSDFPA